MIGSLIKNLFGTRNDKELKRYRKRVALINALEEKYAPLSDDELKSAFKNLTLKAQEGVELDTLLNDSFAITREASKRSLGMRHFDVQFIGGMVLNENRIAEMKTGEGKTLVATLPVILNAMTGKGVHVITVNDYLASRDAATMEPLYNFLGLKVGVVTGAIDEEARKAAYEADVTYGTNNEFGFDYLRDNMKYSKESQVQRGHFFAIVDEVDSILIDEARTPLIISGPTNRKMDFYVKANEVALKMSEPEHYSVDEKNRTVLMTGEGIAKAEELFEVENLYNIDNAVLAHHLDQALKSNYLFKKDVDYVVANGEVKIVDEFTGRISEGRRYSEGLHQALEAKEGVAIKEESQTLADTTYQNYFRMYSKLAGMTGTAQTEATEFAEIYGLDVISIPTNLIVSRQDANDLIYKTEEEKFEAMLKKVKELNAKGQPVLIGTASIDKSEVVHALLASEKIPHTVLNAKHHEQEAQIIKDAGRKGGVTVATNMAGRGVDIKIDDEVRALGGLYILGTERHESRRIDNQLRGRSGRQGDPGVSQFYLSLEDGLLRIFGSDKIKVIMERLGIERGEYIESGMVTRAVENAQKKVESLHFESRKHLLQYDDVANAQRKVIYAFRQDLLDPEFSLRDRIEENRVLFVDELLSACDIMEGFAKEEFNLLKLVEMVAEEATISVEQEYFANLEATDIREKLLDILSTVYEGKMSEVEVARREEIEKIVFLQILDEVWREHLYQMDILKIGIGLRGYNQKDPLVEYKKESFNLFSELIHEIKLRTTKMLLAIRFRQEEAQESIDHAKQMMEESKAAPLSQKQKERKEKYAQKKQLDV